MGEVPWPACIFISRLLNIGGDYPPGFRMAGWFNSIGEDRWWSRMIAYVLSRYEDIFDINALGVTIRATK